MQRLACLEALPPSVRRPRIRLPRPAWLAALATSACRRPARGTCAPEPRPRRVQHVELNMPLPHPHHVPYLHHSRDHGPLVLADIFLQRHYGVVGGLRRRCNEEPTREKSGAGSSGAVSGVGKPKVCPRSCGRRTRERSSDGAGHSSATGHSARGLPGDRVREDPTCGARPVESTLKEQQESARLMEAVRRVPLNQRQVVVLTLAARRARAAVALALERCSASERADFRRSEPPHFVMPAWSGLGDASAAALRGSRASPTASWPGRSPSRRACMRRSRGGQPRTGRSRGACRR